MISQHWFGYWLGAVRQQAITWANVDLDPCCHMVSLGHNELKSPDPNCQSTEDMIDNPLSFITTWKWRLLLQWCIVMIVMGAFMSENVDILDSNMVGIGNVRVFYCVDDRHPHEITCRVALLHVRHRKLIENDAITNAMTVGAVPPFLTRQSAGMCNIDCVTQLTVA